MEVAELRTLIERAFSDDVIALTDGEVAQYLFFSLERPRPHNPRSAAVDARLDPLDPAQRAAIRAVLQHFVDTYGDHQLTALLAAWT